jgi:outer membrane biosynthesis protein TonB
MELSKSEIRKNRSVAVIVTLLAFSFLLLTFFLKKILSVPVQNENASVLFTFSQEEGANAREGSTEGGHSVSPQNKNAQIKSDFTEKESLINSYKSFRQQSSVSEPSSKDNPPDSGAKGDDHSVNSVKEDHIITEVPGRTLESISKMPAGTNAEGTVVVNITVDQNGNVTEASPDGRGTSTTSPELKLMAKQLALSAKFSKGRMEYQRGTITIIFVFN